MFLQVVLIKGDKLYQSKIENGDTITFGDGKKDTVAVEGFVQNQITLKWKEKGLSAKVLKPLARDFDVLPLDTIVVLSEEEQVAMFATSLVSDPISIIKFPYNCKLSFGRSKDNDVTICLPYVSGTHFIIKNESGHLRVEDNGSTNGLYLNGKLTEIARIKSGDVLSILSLNFHVLNGELLVENCGGKVEVNFSEGDVYSSKVSNDGVHCPHYKRSPRNRDKLPTEDITLSSAPNKQQKSERGRMFGTSLISSGAMLASSVAMGVASPALLAARAATMISPIANMTMGGNSYKKQNKKIAEYERERRVKYGAYIEDQKARIESVAKVQHDIINRENPAPSECLDIVDKVKRDLWSRMNSDSDFLSVRLGMGYEQLCVNVKGRNDSDGFKMDSDEIQELSEQIIEETRIVDDIPFRVSLIENQTVGVIGERERVIDLVRNMCISISTLHCFSDVSIMGIFDEAESPEWSPLKWIPHIWNPKRSNRYLAFGEEQTRDMCETLGNIVKSREEAEGDGRISPHIVVIIGSSKLVEREPVLAKLVDNNPKLGITTLFLFDDMYSLPHSCQYIVDLDNGPCAYQRDEYNKRSYFTQDEGVDRNVFNSFARKMSAIELDGFASEEDLPDGITFLGGYGVKRVEDLNVSARWSKSKPYKTLAAPIGAMAAGKTFNFDIIDNSTNATAHGPHGLVAGTTGSGKSELLQTWILSVACNYHPYDVAFVIIDYKGGGMANILSPLPHVIGKITNIDSDISRALISLKSEVARREKIFSECQVNKIDKYIEMFHEGKVSEPLPHLIIVADEFAELKKEEPDFIPTIIQIARVGRSLGIHLVLATQKPSGVVDDQIWSNSQFQICLKVQSTSDSREMIKRPDAAMLTQAGRAYCNTTASFELLQSYWSGAPYVTSNSTINEECKVSIVDFSGTRIKTVKRQKKKNDGPDEIGAIIDYINVEAERIGVEKLRGPWLPELPNEVSLSEVAEFSYDGTDWKHELPWLSVPVGLYDMPNLQTQGLQFLDFAADGHYGVYGASSTGKSTFLKTVIYSLCMNYSPKDVNIYILDCGGWGTSVFSGMPHVGGIAFDGEDEKFEKFCGLINAEISARKQLFMKNAVSSLAKYRENVSDDLPAIIIVIDNITPLFEMYPSIETLLTTVAAQGPTYGIHMILSSNTTSGVRYKIAQNIKGSIAFELTDKGDYSSVVGRPAGGLPNRPGRAFIKNNPPIIFQAAYYSDGSNEKERNNNVRELATKMDSCWKGKRPRNIPVMPEIVEVDALKSKYTNAICIPVGLDYEDVDVVYADMSDVFSFSIIGPSNTGKEHLLKYMADLLVSKEDSLQGFFFDSESGTLAAYEKSSYQYTKWKEIDVVDKFVAKLLVEMEKRLTDGVSDEDERILIVIDDLVNFVRAISNEARDFLVKVCRLAKGLKVNIISCADVSDVTRLYEAEPLTKAIVDFENGLCTGGTLNDYPYVKSSLRYDAKTQEIGRGNAYAFYKGNVKKIKLVEIS